MELASVQVIGTVRHQHTGTREMRAAQRKTAYIVERNSLTSLKKPFQIVRLLQQDFCGVGIADL